MDLDYIKQHPLNGSNHNPNKIYCLTRKQLRNLLDDVWNYINESEEVPSTVLADALIDPYTREQDNDMV